MAFVEQTRPHPKQVIGPTVKRLMPLGKDSVSFVIKTVDQSVIFDAPNSRSLQQHEKNISNVFLSHEHPDHADTSIENGKLDIPTWIHPLAYPILGYLGKNLAEKYPQIDFLSNKDTVTIDDFGDVTALRLSHNTPTMLAYYIQLLSGQSILYCSDHRDGQLTDSACESIEFLRKTHGAPELLIADMTGFGFETFLTPTEQRGYIHAAMKDSYRQQVPTFIFMKPAGDYGLLLYWIKEGLFNGKKVFMPKELLNLFTQMGEIEPTWLHLHSHIKPLESQEQIDMNPSSVYIFDEQRDYMRLHIPHVLVNTTWKQLTRVGTHEVPTYDLPVPGHTRESFEQIYRSAQPKYLAVSHPGNTGYRLWLSNTNANVVLREKNDSIDLTSKRR